MASVLRNFLIDAVKEAEIYLNQCKDAQSSFVSIQAADVYNDDAVDIHIGLAGSVKWNILNHKRKIDTLLNQMQKVKLCHRQSYRSNQRADAGYYDCIGNNQGADATLSSTAPTGWSFTEFPTTTQLYNTKNKSIESALSISEAESFNRPMCNDGVHSSENIKCSASGGDIHAVIGDSNIDGVGSPLSRALRNYNDQVVKPKCGSGLKRILPGFVIRPVKMEQPVAQRTVANEMTSSTPVKRLSKEPASKMHVKKCSKIDSPGIPSLAEDINTLFQTSSLSINNSESGDTNCSENTVNLLDIVERTKHKGQRISMEKLHSAMADNPNSIYNCDLCDNLQFVRLHHKAAIALYPQNCSIQPSEIVKQHALLASKDTTLKDTKSKYHAYIKQYVQLSISQAQFRIVILGVKPCSKKNLSHDLHSIGDEYKEPLRGAVKNAIEQLNLSQYSVDLVKTWTQKSMANLASDNRKKIHAALKLYASPTSPNLPNSPKK